MCRYPASGYPRQRVFLKMHSAEGISPAQLDDLARQLQASAALHASRGDVAVFHLCQECHEALQALNDNPYQEPEQASVCVQHMLLRCWHTIWRAGLQASAALHASRGDAACPPAPDCREALVTGP